MEPSLSAKRTCPKCGSPDYTFRSRKTVAPDPARGEAGAVETKYRCKGCGHEWKARTPLKDAG